jgi:hypothetical protein
LSGCSNTFQLNSSGRSYPTKRGNDVNSVQRAACRYQISEWQTGFHPANRPLQAVEGKGNRGSPAIEDRVDIGAGANAVVLTDFPDGALAVGVPAVIELRWPPVRP